MNDSTWFPLRDSDDSLRRMEALGADMAGQIYKTEDGRGRDHLESHLLMFSRAALTHPAFSRFWDGYVMSDDRVTTIRRGEKGLSQTLMAAGLRVEGLIGRERLLARLRGLDDEALRDVLAAVVHHREDARVLCDGFAVGGECWQAGFLSWVDRALANSRQHLVSTTFIEPAMRQCGMGFVKKSRDTRFQLARARVLEMEATGRIAPMHPAVRAEIAAAVTHWHPQSG